METQTWLSFIINLFRQGILLYSPSHQMTFYMLYLKLQNSKCGITVRMYTIKEKKILILRQGQRGSKQ